MNEELKMRSGVWLIFTKVLSVVLVIASLVLGYFGFVDPRTEEQKAEDYRVSVVSSVAAERAMEALRYARKKSVFTSIEYVSVLKVNIKKYVKIVGYAAGQSVGYCYDVDKKCEIPVQLFDQYVSAGTASDFFVGKEPEERATTFQGEELQFLLEEVGGWH